MFRAVPLASAQIIILPPQYTSKHWAKKLAIPPLGQEGILLDFEQGHRNPSRVTLPILYGRFHHFS
jgi:hypothetical protein